ncbi:hypothetical protein CCAX7_51630 [Capsulimonas corticalis]|uniref:Uncharacterized protein n=1 Tax=Capsulimonas corticalis TaxID=2219043 RepID=A0A402CP16_9BACT|nr:serine acetyltransferase [Capsulimonas corticalis]BDI33112.1 hypothetical protein CCAX7_51630 [Capsulimonas corticalis]
MFNPARIWYFSCWAHQRKLKLLAKILKTVNYFCFRCLLPFEAQIQPDLKLEHLGLGVCVHPNVTIGRGVKLYHHVSLAAETWVGSPYRIVIEDDVTIGAHAIIVGNEHGGIVIGKGAKVGAGALVVKDVAPGQVVVAMPARPVRTESPDTSTIQ